MLDETVTSTPPEYVRAKPRTRRIALVGLVVIVVAGAGAIEWLLPRLSALASSGQISRKSICIGFLIVLLALVVPVVFAGVENWRLGRDAVRTGQFPSPRTRVLVDTRIERGPAAITIGKVQQVLGTILIGAGLALLAVAGFGVYTLW
jgi:hypothetical protein